MLWLSATSFVDTCIYIYLHLSLEFIVKIDGQVEKAALPCKSSISSRVCGGVCDVHSSFFYELKLFLCFGFISLPGEVHTPLSFVPFRWPGSSVSETDGREMFLYMFRGQARPTQQGSSSHQRLTSTSSSVHVQRHNPSLLSFPLNWHEVSDITIAQRPQSQIEMYSIFMLVLFTCHCECLCMVVIWWDVRNYSFSLLMNHFI